MKVGLVLLPLPSIGHLVSMVELSKHILHRHHHHFSITILIMRLPKPTSAFSPDSYIESVATSGLDIRFVELPPMVPPFVKNQSREAFLSLFIDSHRTLVKETIAKQAIDSPSIRISALIIDFFATTMIDVANELGIPAYIYFPSNAAFLGLMLHLPTLHVNIPSDLGELDGEIEVPGMSPLPPLVVSSIMLKKSSDGYTWLVYHGQRFRQAKGIIVNTFAELEPIALVALREGKFLADHPTPPVYTVGPVLALHELDGRHSKHACIKWLDEQPPESVVFLCFGSMGSFPAPQIKELALGLERSGCRFLWSLRCASQEGFHLPVDANPNEVLPDGFLDRTKGRGLVWLSWVPQVAILAHKAIGGFVSHCGWNSTLEILWFDVPILAWPLYAEQRFNRFQLVQDLGLAVELKLDYRSGGAELVSAAEFERAVRCLMDGCDEGSKVRERVKEMHRASREVVEEVGSSFAFLKQLVDQLMT